MELAAVQPSSREVDLIKLVAEYKQMTAVQIRRLVFPDTSAVWMGKVLRKLIATGYLKRRGQWTTGKRGNPPWVYQPTDKGWQLAHKKRHDYRKIHPHFVWTAEAFTLLVEAQRRGELLIAEPKLEVVVGRVRADMSVGLTWPGAAEPTYFYIEVEVYDGKDRPYVENKMRGYLDAWERSSGGFPYVVVAAPDEDHRLEIESTMAQLSAEDAELFKVCVVADLVRTIKTV